MSKFHRGYKFRIYPTEEQAKRIDDIIDFARFAYNWAIAKEIEIYELKQAGLSEYDFYNYIDLDREFRKECNSNPKLAWIREEKFPVNTAKMIFRNVESGYRRFFDKQNPGKPTFKKKNKCKKAFNTRGARFYVKNNKLRMEGLPRRDYIDLGFETGLNLDKAINPVISKDNLGNYYASFSLEEESKSLDIPKSEPIGIDLGIRQTIVLSDGTVYNQPKEKLARLERKRSKLQQHVTRDIKRRIEEADRTKAKYEDIPKSKRAIKREIKLKKVYKKIHNIKNTFYHTITKRIVERNPEYVCMETFSVREIQRTEPYMSDKLAQVSFYDITQKMKYKCKNNDILFIQAPTEFASTKTCSNCGSIKNMDGKHTYICPVCGMVEDRDVNAAKNLKQYGLDLLYSNIGKVDSFIY